jgi:uncharacterized protein YlxW (UPF0749 family)
MKKLYSPGDHRPYAFFVLLPSFDITLDIYIFVLIIAVAMMTGHLNRSRQVARKQRRIAALEKEMVQAHAELLEAQKENCQLEAKLQDVTNPVIAMNSRPAEPKSRPTGTV